MNLQGKKALIMGLANERSIAYGIAKALREAGAELAFTYIPVVEKRMRPLAEELGAKIILPCDVGSDEEIHKMADELQSQWGGELDVLIHSLAYAERADLEHGFCQTSRAGFLKAVEISAYSLVGLTRALLPSLERSKGSVICLSYYGAERVVTNYNVMGVAKAALESSVRYLAADIGEKGIRVNAISAGPIRTLAASGVKDFKSILSSIESKAPLRRNITTEDVGQTALFLASKASGAITGEVLYVDCGYNIMGL